MFQCAHDPFRVSERIDSGYSASVPPERSQVRHGSATTIPGGNWAARVLNRNHRPKPSTFSGSRNQRGLPSGFKRNQTDVPKKGPTLSRKLVSIAAVLALLVSGGLCFSQDLEAKYKEKLEKEFVKKISWIQSLEEAQKVSAKTGKPIFGYFTRSYAP